VQSAAVLCERRWKINLVVLMIDGIHFGGQCCGGPGIAEGEKKHVGGGKEPRRTHGGQRAVKIW